jgi:ParB family chromosome partitioning protein
MKERRILGRGLSSLISDPRLLERTSSNFAHTPVFEGNEQQKKISALGDGIDNNIENKGKSKEESSPFSNIGMLNDGGDYVLTNLKIEQIFPNPQQPRKHFDNEGIAELASSVKEHGVLQPIIVTKVTDNKFEIIAGERRWRAASLAGLEKMPVVVKNTSNEKLLETAIIENIQREDLNPVDEALAYEALIKKHGYNQDKLCKSLGKSHSYISNMLRLLNLPEEILNLTREGKISAGHARILIGVENPIEMAYVFIDKKMSVRGAEDYAREFSQAKQQKARTSKHNKLTSKINNSSKIRDEQYYRSDYDPSRKLFSQSDSDLRAIERSISEEIGMSVNIYDTNKGGELSVKFQTLEQLDWLLERISMPKVFSPTNKK